MITLIAKLSLVVGIHIAIIVVWQRRTGAAWRTLLFALVPLAIIYLVRLPLNDRVPQYFWSIEMEPLMVWGIMTFLIPVWFIYGAISHGARWLSLRYVAKSVQSWRDGVMFGIGYSSSAFLLMLWGLLAPQTIDPGPVPASPILRDFLLDDFFVWEHAILLVWHWAILVMILNVGTSLAVLYSVRRRQVWTLLAAVMVYAMYGAAPWVAIGNIPHVITDQVFGLWSFTYWRELVRLIAVLPALCMIFFLRKPLDRLTIN